MASTATDADSVHPTAETVQVDHKRHLRTNLRGIPVAIRWVAHTATLTTMSDGTMYRYERLGPGGLSANSSNEMSRNPSVTSDGESTEVRIVNAKAVMLNSSKKDVVGFGDGVKIQAVNWRQKPLDTPLNVIPPSDWKKEKEGSKLVDYLIVTTEDVPTGKRNTYTVHRAVYHATQRVTKQEFDSAQQQYVEQNPYRLFGRNCQALTQHHDQLLGIKSPAPRLTCAPIMDALKPAVFGRQVSATSIRHNVINKSARPQLQESSDFVQDDMEHSEEASGVFTENGPKLPQPSSHSRPLNYDTNREPRFRRGDDGYTVRATVCGLGALGANVTGIVGAGSSIYVTAGLTSTGAPTIVVGIAFTNPIFMLGCMAVGLGIGVIANMLPEKEESQ